MSNPTNDGINLNYLANVRPSSRQLVWQRMEMYAFIHFGMNTMTDREWGLGHEDPALFDPQKVDVEQWMDALVAGGMTGVILLYLVVFRFGLTECLEIEKRWYFNAFAIPQVVTGYDCMERNVTVFVCGLYAE